MDPFAAFKEISRVLKKGGAHIFTIPWYPGLEKTRQRARMKDDQVEFLSEPVYNGNPIDPGGSLVTYDWGMDMPEIIFNTSGLITTIYFIKDQTKGIEGESLEVFISKKMS